jgi:ATP-binding cassette subfamily F protein 3
MPLIVGSNLAKSFGADEIFSDITVSVPHGARIALVGPNGVGKTTLLNILAGLDSPTVGQVHRARRLRIGYLPQESHDVLRGASTIWEEMLTAFADLREQEARLREVERQLADGASDALLEEYGRLQAAFEGGGGYVYEARIPQVLNGLGFDEADYHRPAEQLSGGQRTRALLARLLLEEPDVLILDEPTNHLDIEAIEWLERWLKGFPGALIMVSHDRYFMDSLADRVWEMLFGGLQEYTGNYSKYVVLRAERYERQTAQYEAQQEYIKKTEDFIQRYIAGQRSSQAQGRRRRLERFLRDQAIDRPREHKTMRLALRAARRSGDRVLMTRRLAVGYSDAPAPLFHAPDIMLFRGECAALMGPNGIGKTTFIKTVLGNLPPLEGEVILGANVEIGYFAQAHRDLNTEKSVLQEFMDIGNMTISQARSYLGPYLFSGEDVHKPLSALSGGERGRVALAKLALSGANFLLLDEPTNHLDIPSQEILEAVLQDFGGTILLVSHDRYLIRSLATQIWALTEEGLTVFDGPYSEYLEQRESEAVPAGERAAKSAAGSEEALSPSPRPRSGLSPYRRAIRLEEIEAAVHAMEAERDRLTAGLEAASLAGRVEEVARMGQDYAETEAQLEALMAEWEMLLAEEQELSSE